MPVSKLTTSKKNEHPAPVKNCTGKGTYYTMLVERLYFNIGEYPYEEMRFAFQNDKRGHVLIVRCNVPYISEGLISISVQKEKGNTDSEPITIGATWLSPKEANEVINYGNPKIAAGKAIDILSGRLTHSGPFDDPNINTKLLYVLKELQKIKRSVTGEENDITAMKIIKRE